MWFAFWPGASLPTRSARLRADAEKRADRFLPSEDRYRAQFIQDFGMTKISLPIGYRLNDQGSNPASESSRLAYACQVYRSQ
jgi:hypothetical protein